jgi:predicted Zn-dependent protease
MQTNFRKISAVIGLWAMIGGSLWAAKKPPKTTPDPTPAPASDQAPTTTPAAPDHAQAYYHFMLARRYKELAGFYNRPEYIDRAVAEYKEAIAADPDSLFLRIELAELYWRSGHTAEGIQEAEAVLKVDPDYPDAHRLLSRIYFHNLDSTQEDHAAAKENLTKAIEHLEALVRVSPTDTDSLLLLGRLYRANNQSAKAEEIFRKVLQTDPASAVGVANLAELYIQQSAFDQAIDVLSKIPDSDMTSQLYGMLGYSYSQTQQYGKAIATYEKALAQDGDN